MKTSHKFRLHGFTPVSMVIVVSTLALLTSVALPAINYKGINLKSQNARLLKDYRTHEEAFIRYALENDNYASDRGSVSMHSGMREYLPPTWVNSHAGGQWTWDYTVRGITAGISLNNANVETQQMMLLDAKFDDGDLATGSFRKTNINCYTLVIEE